MILIILILNIKLLSVVTSLISPCFLTFSVIFPKTASTSKNLSQNHFLLFFLDQYLGKNGKSLWSSCNFSRIEHQLEENALHHILHHSFFMKPSLNWEVSLIHSKLFIGSFCDIAHPYNLLISQRWRYDDSLSLS